MIIEIETKFEIGDKIKIKLTNGSFYSGEIKNISFVREQDNYKINYLIKTQSGYTMPYEESEIEKCENQDE